MIGELSTEDIVSVVEDTPLGHLFSFMRTVLEIAFDDKMTTAIKRVTKEYMLNE